MSRELFSKFERMILQLCIARIRILVMSKTNFRSTEKVLGPLWKKIGDLN